MRFLFGDLNSLLDRVDEFVVEVPFHLGVGRIHKSSEDCLTILVRNAVANRLQIHFTEPNRTEALPGRNPPIFVPLGIFFYKLFKIVFILNVFARVWRALVKAEPSESQRTLHCHLCRRATCTKGIIFPRGFIIQKDKLSSFSKYVFGGDNLSLEFKNILEIMQLNVIYNEVLINLLNYLLFLYPTSRKPGQQCVELEELFSKLSIDSIYI